MKSLGDRIRELREQRDLSVRELAKKVAVSAAFLSDVELGRRYPSDDKLALIASSLGTKIVDLKEHDARPPLQELRRRSAADPTLGFALRQVVDEGVSAQELLELVKRVREQKRRK